MPLTDIKQNDPADRIKDHLSIVGATLPEETIYQIGTMEDSVSPDVLLEIVGEFMMELERRFGDSAECAHCQCGWRVR